MKTSVTTTQTTEITLSPALKTKLAKRLKTFQDNKREINRLSAANDAIKEDIDTLFADAGEFDALVAGVKVDDISLKYVTSTRSVLDTKKLLAQGVTMAQIERATETKPGKPYTKITLPGEKD